jgi:3D (Asp-Asp-Asp) domain-containing protein
MKNLINIALSISIISFLVFAFSCNSPKEDPYVWKSIEVTATAYNSVAWQTQGNPIIAAWGDSLKPDVRSIAVSRNLIALGLKHNTPVKIEGFDSIFLVLDKMHSRWLNRIDIYMGTDIKKAKEWGRKKVTIQYGIPKDSISPDVEAK